MKTISKDGSKPVKMWTDGVPVEPGALVQLDQIASLPFVWPHVAVMPDVHVGKGATVGSVVPTIGAVVPSAVGVDIGCGMSAVKTTARRGDLPADLKRLRLAIEEAIPHGRSHDGGERDVGGWRSRGEELPTDVEVAWMGLAQGWKKIVERNPKVRGRGAVEHHLGTLGTGNHFIEVCVDEDDAVWFMLHSGSRGPGNRIGSYFIDLAKRECAKWFVKLPNWDLAFLPEGTDAFTAYIEAVRWAQEFARENRRLMMDAVVRVFSREVSKVVKEDVIDCHHNYVEKENHFGKNVWVTRKGAVNASKGRLGLIPGSMGAKSFVVVGKGDRDSLNSCSHGAGRKMSRTEARSTFTLADHRNATESVECRKDKDVIDETPGAYKDVDAVLAAEADLVDVVHTLKQILCVKG